MHNSQLKKILLFLKRIGHCRGFGIQSPTDFAFVNDVIYERLPYYAYEELDSMFPSFASFDRKLARTYFRICNFVQPQYYVFGENVPEVFAKYTRRGCLNSITGRTLYFVSLPESYKDGDCIIIPNIYDEGKEEWEVLCNMRSKEHFIMYDFYYFGIVFVDKHRYPELYTVNFY